MLWLDVSIAYNVPTISSAYQHANRSLLLSCFFILKASEALPNGITATTQHLKTYICSLRLLHHLTKTKGQIRPWGAEFLPLKMTPCPLEETPW